MQLPELFVRRLFYGGVDIEVVVIIITIMPV